MENPWRENLAGDFVYFLESSDRKCGYVNPFPSLDGRCKGLSLDTILAFCYNNEGIFCSLPCGGTHNGHSYHK